MRSPSPATTTSACLVALLSLETRCAGPQPPPRMPVDLGCTPPPPPGPLAEWACSDAPLSSSAPVPAAPLQVEPTLEAPCLDAAQRVDAGRDPELRAADDVMVRGCLTRRCVGHLLLAAREHRDLVVATCERDKLSQVEVLLRTTLRHRETLAGALAAHQERDVEHERAVLAVVGQRFEALKLEARSCSGGGMATVGPHPVRQASLGGTVLVSSRLNATAPGRRPTRPGASEATRPPAAGR